MNRKAKIEIELNTGNIPIQKDEKETIEKLIFNQLNFELNLRGITIEDIICYEQKSY